MILFFLLCAALVVLWMLLDNDSDCPDSEDIPWFLAVIAASAASAAPPPRVRQVTRPPLYGEYRMQWRGMEYTAAFAKDGHYRARYVHATEGLIGKWRLTGDTLYVEEWHEHTGDPEDPIRWTVKLEPGKWTGSSHHNDYVSPFKLEKP